MRVFLASLVSMSAGLISFQASAAEFQRLQSSGSRYEVYQISESNVRGATVFIDYKAVQTDCHGLDYQYEVNSLKNGTYVITKKPLMKTMQMCAEGSDRTAQDGIKIELPVKSRSGYSSLYAEIIAPAEAQVEVKLER